MPFTISTESILPVGPMLPWAKRVCLWVQRGAVGLALAVAGSNLLIWIVGSVPRFAVDSGVMIMRINAAVGMIAAALSLACWSGEPMAVRRSFAQGLAALVVLVGLLTAAQDLAGINLGIDLLLGPATIPGDEANVYVPHPGRMSLNAALALFFLGLALLGLDWGVNVGQKRLWFAPGFAVLATLPVSLGLVGYLLGIRTFTGILRSTNILLHSAVVLFVLSLAVLAARPQRPPMRRILSTGADGVLLRRTLPGSAALLLALGWLIGRGRASGLVAPGEGTALMLYGGLVLLFGLLIAASRAAWRQQAQAQAAAEALQRGQERSRAIIDTALDAVLLMDAEGLIVDWNPAAERIFGWPREEVIGQPLAERIIPEELRASHPRGLGHLAKTGEGPVLGKRLELPASRRDGTKFPVELSIERLPGPGRTLFVGFLRDITERQAAEEKLRTAKETAESASHAKDQFVAALSHELRTPLTPVLLSAAALREDERLPADVREQLSMMERNIALEARLIDDLLDLTRIERGKFKLHTELCDAHSLLGHAVEMTRDEALAQQVALSLELEAERFGLAADSARLQQVFWNLLKNAVKFTPAGGRVAIRTSDDLAGSRLIIEVKDTGTGFSSEAAERIFQPFEQAVDGAQRSRGGLGLGLSIARAIVDLHGGTIHAESPGPGLGATFTVKLPNPILPPQGLLHAHGHESNNGDAEVPRRILLVEDHEPTLEVLSRLLRRAGHEIIPAQSVAAAQAAAAEQEFDVLISDLGLPDGTGLELIAALRGQYPHFPAIALSGYGMEEDVQRTRAAGFAAHLIKPVDFDQLRRALGKLSARSRLPITNPGG